MEILYLSHCVPNPPDKGERIRAFHEIQYLAARHRLHLVCFARGRAEQEAARQLADSCASVWVEPLSPRPALARAALRFALGASLTASFHGSREMRRHVQRLAQEVPLSAAIAYSTIMGPYAPEGIPLLLDMVDVDSEKWFEYARLRRPGFPYALEARRLRRMESSLAARACRTFLSTQREEKLLLRLCPGAATRCLENGISAAYFDPAASPKLPWLEGRRYVVFIGVMDYFPNADAVCWFAGRVYPGLRRHDPAAEFFVVGRNPARRVLELSRIPGITVTGAVDDVRPYLASASAVVVPLRIARGIQNKALEALAMGKPVLASPTVAAALGDSLPPGLLRCDSEEDFIDAAAAALASGPAPDPRIRESVLERFCWERNLALLDAELRAAAERA